ncbi:MAG TPA: ParB/RepB/Spo0J family partition protein [Acidimicrobiia bacterium]|nr:ParB/RepB/Spo0J family partition protein [Acidimicrobiia bacterium]
MRLLGLPGVIQGLIADGALSAGAARALLGTDDTAYAVKIAGLAATEGWSVRQVEEAVRARRDEAAAGGATRQKAVRPAQILALEERLSERLGSPVRIDYGARGGGKLTVRFGSVDDLERIYRTLLG